MVTAGVLLAAGHSRRFGGDKLSAPLAGAPLLRFASSALLHARLDHRICVGRNVDGFDYIPAAGGQSASLRAGVMAAVVLGADRVVIALADMPFVDSALIDAVVAACPDDGASAAWDGVAMPPACFAAPMFPALLSLSGDRGAGSLLHAASLVPAVGKLFDIDTPDDLATAEKRLANGIDAWS